MGRELRRKQAKKEGKSLVKTNNKESNQIKKLIKITILLFVIMALIYLISALFITKELDWFKKDEETTEKSNSVANTILASSIFKQKEESYYVYFYDFKEEDNEIINIVNTKLSNEKVYKVNTSSALNNNYISKEESNKNAKKLEELKVKNNTLIKIIGDVITEYYEDEEIKINFN